jgi:hypothetical protein
LSQRPSSGETESASSNGHAKAFPVVEPPDDESKLVWFRSLHSLLASRHVLAPRWRLPWHESGDGGRDAPKNLLCFHHLELAELQSWGLDDNHCISLSTTDNMSIDSWRKQAIALKTPHTVNEHNGDLSPIETNRNIS